MYKIHVTDLIRKKKNKRTKKIRKKKNENHH